MAKSVEFEVLLKNGQFKEAANESEKAIRDVESAMSNSASSMADDFSSVSEQIEFQKEIIQHLKNEVKKLEAALKEAAPGKQMYSVAEELNAVKKELAGEEKALTELQGSLEQTEKKHVSLRSQLRAVREELVAMEMEGKRGTEEYRALQERAGALTDAMKDATQQMNIMAHDQRGLQGIISGLTGVSGAFSAAAGAVGLFGDENENLQKIMLKVQSLMAITVGLQQVEQTLNKDSAFRLVTLNGLKEWWAKVVKESAAAETAETATMKANTAATVDNAAAVTAAGTAAKGASGAFSILGNAIKSIPVLGWIAAAIAALGTVIGLIAKEKKHEKENNAILNERCNILSKINSIRRDAVNSVALEEVKMKNNIRILQTAKEGTDLYNKSIKDIANSLGVNEEWLKSNKNRVDELADAWILVKRAEAISDAYAKEYAEQRIEGEKKLIAFRKARQTNDQDKNKEDLVNAGFSDNVAQAISDNIHKRFNGNNAKIREGVEWLDDYEKKLQKDNANALKSIDAQQKAAINSQIKLANNYSNLTNGSNAPDNNVPGGKTTKDYGDDNEDYLIGFEANYQKLVEEREKIINDIESKRGKTTIVNGVSVTIDDKSINEEIEAVLDQFNDKVIELEKKYGIRIDIPVDVEEEAAIPMLTDEALKSSVAFSALYDNVERLGNSMKKLLKERIEKLIEYIKAHQGDLSFKASQEDADSFGMSAEALNSLLQSDGALNQLVADLNLIEKSNAIRKLIKSVDEFKRAKNNAKAGDLVSEEDVAKAQDAMISAIEQVRGVVENDLSKLGRALSEMGEYLDNDSLREAGNVMQQILENVQAAEAGAQAWGGWWGAIIGGVIDLLPRIVSWATQENKLNKYIEETNKELKLLDKNIQLLQLGDIDKNDALKMDELYDKYIAGIEKEIAKYEKTNAEKHAIEIAELNLLLAQIKAEREEMWQDLWEKELGVTADDVFGTISDEIWDAFTSGQTAVENFEDTFDEMMMNVVKKKVLWNLLGDRIQQFVEDVGNASAEGSISPEEIEQFRNEWNAIIQDGVNEMEGIRDIFSDLGAFSGEYASLTGSIKGIPSEQASMLAGQMNAMRTAQASQTEILTNQLEALNDIQNNTRYLRDIYSILKSNNVGTNNNLYRAYGQN